MITEEQIAELVAFDAREASVLSVYLGLDPSRRVRRSHRTVFDDLVKESRARLAEPAREELAREAAPVESWLAGQEPRGKGLALFSCAPRGLWRAHVLAVPVADYLAFEPAPDLAPLHAILDDYERYAVALVDKRKARLLTVFLGAIEESDAFVDPVPGKHNQGGPAQARFQRHHEAHVHWHLKRVALALSSLLRRRGFDRLILAGPEEAASELRGLLPRALARRLVATIPAEVSATDMEILEKTLEVERRVERAVEERLLADLLDAAGPRGRATLGLRPTLDALWQGTVQKLVAADDVHLTGTECLACGRLDAGVAACRSCGAGTRPVPDLLHRAMDRARQMAGSVEVVHGEAAGRLRAKWDGVGALLRHSRVDPTAAPQRAEDTESA